MALEYLELPIAVFIAIIIALGVLPILVWYFHKKAKRWEAELYKKQSKAKQMGQNQYKGDIAQILGTFGLITEYKELMILSSTSQQSSLDLLGVKDDRLDFIELKYNGADLTSKEREIKRLVEEKKVNYVIKDVRLPDEVKIVDRERNRQ